MERLDTELISDTGMQHTALAGRLGHDKISLQYHSTQNLFTTVSLNTDHLTTVSLNTASSHYSSIHLCNDLVKGTTVLIGALMSRKIRRE